jgi:adhesin/invasin
MSRTSPFMVGALGATTLVALVALGCSNDSTDPTGPGPVSSGIVIASGDRQVGVMAGSLGEPLTVKVTDLAGAALPGARVTFAVTSGGGRVEAAAATSDHAGLATMTWILGSGADAAHQSATATISGHTVTFTATATALVTKVSGDSQVGEVTESLGEDPTVLVHDALDNPVPGLLVNWNAFTGGGTASASQSVSDAAGHASTSWTLGPTVGAGAQTLQAYVAHGTPVTYTASAVLTSGTLSILSGNNQTTVLGWRTQEPPAVRITKGQGAGLPVAGVDVHWQVMAGGGTVAATQSTTDRAGVARAYWTVGAVAGPNSQRLNATVASIGGAPVEFVASAVPQAASIVKIAGDSQVATATQPLAQPLVVEVRDVAGDAQPGVVVHWQASDVCNGWCYREVKGTLSSDSSVTDSLGRATVGFVLPWLAGYSAVVLATVDGGVPPTVFHADILPGPPATLVSYYGNDQSAPAGTQLPMVIEVWVLDEFANGIPGVTVQWAAAPGSGSTEVASSVTTSTGNTWTHWTIGPTVGTKNQTATATVAGLTGSPVTFAASATAGP